MKPQIVAGNRQYLAEEIITDILKRLPVKSLIRFQSVCKPWKNLIRSALFITEHLHYSTHQNSCLLLKYQNMSQPLHLRLLDWEMQIHEFFHSRVFTRLIGSINGLLCLYPFVLWNPATREARLLPLPREQYDPCRSTTGFGYSPIVNDYKIVRIYSNFKLDGYTLIGAKVYSLSTDSWKDVDLGVLQGVKLNLLLVNHVSANGIIFWPVLNSDAIVSYDIATEESTLIPFSAPLSTKFTVYDDKLAFVSIKNKGIELWVLEKGIDSSSETWSWIKKHTERYPSESLLWCTIWRNHLTVYGHYPSIHDLALYLFKIPTNEMKASSILQVDGDRPHYVFNYAESLVPLGQHPH